MDEDVGARDEAPGIGGQPDVSAELVDSSLQPGVVQRREIERTDGVTVGDESPCQVQAQEARAAGDRDEHGAER